MKDWAKVIVEIKNKVNPSKIFFIFPRTIHTFAKNSGSTTYNNTGIFRDTDYIDIGTHWSFGKDVLEYPSGLALRTEPTATKRAYTCEQEEGGRQPLGH